MNRNAKTYQVLARKWRPQTFADLIGQEHVTRTLQNTITQNRVGHAYLFVGSRGIGKTSGARIFAKALNCEAGVVTEPCCQCQSCREIASGSSMDVIEIDGASHNKVEHIRDIRNNVIFTPSRGRYKIYIIDEVHMLTNAAWNALLKTLEEPPPHVKFFFATTEPHKVLPTVVSRCQRFDLKRIPVPLIVKRLEEIVQAEQVQADERALAAIARAADGGMRDALSILDQIIAFCSGRDRGTPIQETDVIEIFGLASGLELRDMVAAMLGNDVASAMGIIQQLADHGRDLERLFADLVQYSRNVMVATVCADPAHLLEVTPSELQDLLALSRSSRPQLVTRILEGLVSAEGGIRHALNKRVFLEAAMVRIMRDAHSLQIDDLIARLNELRQGGLNIPMAQVSPGPSGQTPPSPPAPARHDIKKNVITPPVEPPRPQAQAAPEPEEPMAEAPVEVAPPQPAAAAAWPEEDSARQNQSMADDLPPWDQDEEPDAETTIFYEPTPEPEPAPDSQPAASASAAAPPPPEPDPMPRSPEVQLPESQTQPGQLWQRLLAEIATRPGGKLIHPLLETLQPVSLINHALAVAYHDDFPGESLDLIQQPENLTLIQDCFRRIYPESDATVIIKRYLESVSDESLKQRPKSTPEIRQRVEASEFVRRVCDAFGGTVIDVRGH